MRKNFLLMLSLVLLSGGIFTSCRQETQPIAACNEFFKVEIQHLKGDSCKVRIFPKSDTLSYYFDMTTPGIYEKYNSFSSTGYSLYIHDLVADLSGKFMVPSLEIGNMLLFRGDSDYVFPRNAKDDHLILFISAFDQRMNPLSVPLVITVPFS